MIAALVSLGGFVVAQTTEHDWLGFFAVALAGRISYIGCVVVWYRSRL
jgi:hypothetical protein